MPIPLVFYRLVSSILEWLFVAVQSIRAGWLTLRYPDERSVFRDAVLTSSAQGWVVAGFNWRFLTSFRAWEARDGKTFRVQTLAGIDLERPTGNYTFRHARLTQNAAGEPVLLWIDESSRRERGTPPRGCIRTAHRDANRGWSVPLTLATGVAPTFLDQPVAANAAVPLEYAFAEVHPGNGGPPALHILRLGATEWELSEQVPYPTALWGRRSGAIFSNGGDHALEVVLGGASTSGDSTLLSLVPPFADERTEHFAVVAVESGAIQTLSGAEAPDGTAWLIALTLIGEAGTIAFWRRTLGEAWVCEARWSVPPDFHVQAFEVISTTTATCTVGMQMARMLPEPHRIFVLHWDGDAWRVGDSVPQNEHVLMEPRWLKDSDGSLSLFGLGASRRGLYQLSELLVPDVPTS